MIFSPLQSPVLRLWVALALSVALHLGVVLPWLERLGEFAPTVPERPPLRAEVRLLERPAPRPAPLPRVIPRPRPATPVPAPPPPPRPLATAAPPPLPSYGYPRRKPSPRPRRPAESPSPLSPVAQSPLPPSPTPSSSPVTSASPSPSPVAIVSPEPDARPEGGDRRAKRIAFPQPPVPEGKTVRVRFEIAASGQARPSLLSGTGDPALDQSILTVLQQWKWEPALLSGQAVDSVEVFRVSSGEAPAR